MFGKKYKKRKYTKEDIDALKRKIENMNFEWDNEKKLYTDEMKEMYYKQKVEYVVGSIDLSQCYIINRPLYGLSKNDASIIAERTEKHIINLGFKCCVEFHYDKFDECYVIDVYIHNFE